MEESKKPKKIYDKKSAKVKIEQYCAYQERSQQEVRDKLYDMGLHQKEVEELISDLITDNFLNEERFAITYARGKCRIKHWGRIKIKRHLKLKKVSDYCIKKALKEIDGDEYIDILKKELEKKASKVKDTDPYIRKHKIAQYLNGRGFEQDLIWDLLGNE